MLLPPKPDEQCGWGRFKYIVRAYPTAPVEILVGIGCIMRGAWVSMPGHHPGIYGVSAELRLALNILLAIFGVVQIYATLWEQGKTRAFAAITTNLIVAWLGTFWALTPGIWSHAGATVPMFFILLGIGDTWVAARTPPLLPLRRWLARLMGEDGANRRGGP